MAKKRFSADFKAQRGWVEGWGTGTLRMAGYCKQNDTPLPEFQEYSGGFSVIFRFKEAMHTNTDPLLTIPELCSRQKEIITILSVVDEMPLKEINQKLQKPLPERTLRKDLSMLKSRGILGSRGQARATSWFILQK